MADLTFTTIEESARAVFKISRDEYAACNYIQTWSSHPANKQPGWCDRTRQQMGDFIGISPRGIMKMLDRMESMGLIQRFSETRFVHRITQKWFETVTLAKENRKGEQSASFEGNKVPDKGEQSASFEGNKVRPHKEYNKKPKESGKNTPTKPEGFTIPKRVETADEAEEIIMAWANGEGRQSVRSWYENALRKCTVGDVKDMVQAFVHAYLTIGDAGKRERMERDPLQCFKYTFKVFLKGQHAFERKEETKKQANGQNTAAVYEQPTIRVFRTK